MQLSGYHRDNFSPEHILPQYLLTGIYQNKSNGKLQHWQGTLLQLGSIWNPDSLRFYSITLLYGSPQVKYEPIVWPSSPTSIYFAVGIVNPAPRLHTLSLKHSWAYLRINMYIFAVASCGHQAGHWSLIPNLLIPRLQRVLSLSVYFQAYIFGIKANNLLFYVSVYMHAHYQECDCHS